MPNKRDLSLDQYGISKNRYRELANFCLQYREFVAEKQSCYSLDGKPMNGMPRSAGVSDTTARKAERAYILGKHIELIEQTAIEAGGSLYQWFLKAVTEDMRWEDLMPPCGRRQFYEKRRQFFFLLSLKKG